MEDSMKLIIIGISGALTVLIPTILGIRTIRQQSEEHEKNNFD